MKLSNLVKKGIIVRYQTPCVCNLQRKYRGQRGLSNRVCYGADKYKNVRSVSLKGDRVYIEFC
jgi:hypothetical protein